MVEEFDIKEYVYYLVRQIPPGRISTYGAVAKALGDANYARAIGGYMNRNPDPDTMPCFKIICSDGRLGGFGCGKDDKIRRLEEEGISVDDGYVVDFKDIFFDGFCSEYPLKKRR